MIMFTEVSFLILTNCFNILAAVRVAFGYS